MVIWFALSVASIPLDQRVNASHAVTVAIANAIEVIRWDVFMT